MTKRLALFALLAVVTAVPLHADFRSIARAIDRQSGVKRVWIPFLGLARTLVRIVEPSGVHDFQLVTFEGAGRIDARELQSVLRKEMEPGFTPLVQVRSRRSGEWSFIYVRPREDGRRVELIVLAHDDEDTVLVRVDVNADVLAREINDEPRTVIRVAKR